MKKYSETEQIERALAVAFRDSKYPGDDEIVQGGIDGSDPERTVFFKAYRNRHWSQVPETTIQKWTEIPYFTDSGFAFYLPRFIEIALQKWSDESFADAISSLLLNLTVIGKTSKSRTSKYDALTLEQKKVVASFLNWYIRSVPPSHQIVGADEAFEMYWKQFHHDRQ